MEAFRENIQHTQKVRANGVEPRFANDFNYLGSHMSGNWKATEQQSRGTFWTLKRFWKSAARITLKVVLFKSISPRLVALRVRVLNFHPVWPALHRQQLRIKGNFKPQGRASDNDLSTKIRKRQRPLVVRGGVSYHYGSSNLKRDPTAKLTLRTSH